MLNQACNILAAEATIQYADPRTHVRGVAGAVQVFENAQVVPDFIQGRDDQMDVALLLKERAVKTMDLDMEWALAPVHSRFPLPIPAAIVPGGSVTYEDRNFWDAGDHMSASLMCSNFLHPTDDLSCRVQYRKPFVFGRAAAEDLVVNAFNARRLSSVFAGAPAPLFDARWESRSVAESCLQPRMCACMQTTLKLRQCTQYNVLLVPWPVAAAMLCACMATQPPVCDLDATVFRLLGWRRSGSE